MDNHETAATDIAGTRIRDRERETDSDRCVNRIATAIENFNADARGMLLLGDDHTVVRMDRLRRSHCRRARDRRDLRRCGGGEDEGDERKKSANHQLSSACPGVSGDPVCV
jgi:hypothetical protein